MIARRIVHVLVAAIAAFLFSLNGADAQQVRMRWQDFISGPDILRVLPALHRLRCALAEENAAHRRDGSNLDCVRKERVTPFVKRFHLAQAAQSFDLCPYSKVNFYRGRPSQRAFCHPD
jgi:hypothetical protein